jgi:cysteinyl-tRNA synthetase
MSPPCCAVLETFDAIFSVLAGDDAEKLRALGVETSAGLSDADVEALVAERQAARKRRDFAASDRLRQQLADHGILLEDTREGGIRWKRK